MTIKGSNCPDSDGSPLNVSAIVTYSVKDPVKATYHVKEINGFLNNQAYQVLRRVCGKFPYRSNNPDQATLLGDASIISTHLRDLL